MPIDGLNWLYAQMELIGLTSFQEAADACGIDKAALWRYFNGDNRPSIDRLPNLCRFNPINNWRRRRESKSEENVSLHPDWLQTAVSSRNFSVVRLANHLISR